MKFKLDENVPWVLKHLIESRGDHQVDSVYHEKISGISDFDLLVHCLKEKGILITLDQDFANEFASNKKANIDKLLEELRNDLRTELNLEKIDDNINHLRIII